MQKRRSNGRRKELGPHAAGVLYDSENGFLLAPVGDIMIGKRLGFKGKWDMHEIHFLIDKLDPQDTVYFVGTHIGSLLIPIAKHCSKVVGYEANPDTYRILNWNLKLNEVSNAKIFHHAIGDASRNVEFYKNKVNTGGSKLKPIVDRFIYNFDAPETVQVGMVAMDQHIQENNLPEPDVIVMDIEGAEYFALKGMQEILARVKVLYVEYVPDHLKDVAGVSVSEFLDLIVPHFNKVELINGKTSIELSDGGKKLNETLSQMHSMDNLYFWK